MWSKGSCLKIVTLLISGADFPDLKIRGDLAAGDAVQKFNAAWKRNRNRFLRINVSAAN
jgi:hypothetical protein